MRYDTFTLLQSKLINTNNRLQQVMGKQYLAVKLGQPAVSGECAIVAIPRGLDHPLVSYDPASGLLLLPAKSYTVCHGEQNYWDIEGVIEEMKQGLRIARKLAKVNGFCATDWLTVYTLALLLPAYQFPDSLSQDVCRSRFDAYLDYRKTNSNSMAAKMALIYRHIYSHSFRLFDGIKVPFYRGDYNVIGAFTDLIMTEQRP